MIGGYLPALVFFFSAGDTAAASPDQRAVFCRAVLVLSADGVP